MKQLVATVLAITITALLPNISMACSASPPNKSLGERAKVILVGKAIRSQWQEELRELHVEVEVTEEVVGSGSSQVSAISSCGLPIKNGERVIVAIFEKQAFVYSADIYESAFREGSKNVR